jgi:cysteine desulfurase
MAELGAVCRERGVVFHSDAVQWFGKEPFADIGRFNANLVSVCAHKIHGPKGAGLLFIQSPLHPDPVFWGGAQEIERRAGTENLPAIIGLVTALEKLVSPPVFDRVRLKPLADKLVSAIENMDGCEMVSPRENSLANTVAFAVRGADGMALLAGLDLEGICASSGSACSAGSLEPSHVLAALGRRDAAGSLIRFSLGRDSTLSEVDFVRSVLPEVIQRARRARPRAVFPFRQIRAFLKKTWRFMRTRAHVACPDQSARGLAQSKTLRVHESHRPSRQPSTAFLP